MKAIIQRIQTAAILAVLFASGLASTARAAAPVPTVVWESDFVDNGTKTGTDGNTYTFKIDNTGNSIDNGVLVISSTATRGATIELGETTKTKISVLVKYSNLSAPGGTSTTNCFASIRLANGNNFPLFRNENASSLKAGLSYAGSATAAMNFNDSGASFPNGSGYALFSYQLSANNAGGTKAYVGSDIASLSGKEITSIKWSSNSNITRIALGGPCADNTNPNATAWPNLKIEKVAIFLDTYYSAADVVGFKWPSEVAADLKKWIDDSRTIYAWRGGANFDQGSFGAVSPDGTIAAGTTVGYTEFGANRTAPGHVLYYDAAGYTANTDAKFTPFAIGGLCVKSAADSSGTPYTVRGYNSKDANRQTWLGAAGYETYFEFDESFVFARTNGVSQIAGTVNLSVAAGKEFDLNSQVGAKSAAQLASGAVLKMSGEGNLKVHSIDAIDGTLDFSALSGRSAALPFINGTVMLGANTGIVLPAGTTSPYKLGTAITGTYPNSLTIGTKTYAAVVSAGENDGEIAWSISEADMDSDNTLNGLFTSTTTTGDYAINVTDSSTLTLDSATTVGSITFNVAEGKTLTLSGTSLTATTIYVTGKGTVKVTTAGTLQGTLKGDGTVMYYGVLPASSGITLNNSAWTGTVWIYNFGTINGSDRVGSDLTSNMSNWGNANSKVKFTLVKAYAPNESISCPYTLVLEDGAGASEYAWRCDNGFSTESLTFKALEGDGTFYDIGSVTAPFKFLDAADFRGTFYIWHDTLAGHKILIGANASYDTAGSVAIGSGQTVTINKAWTIRNNFKVDGTVNVNAAIITGYRGILVYGTVNYDASIAKPTIVYDGGTLNVNAADSGSITVNAGGVANIAADVAGAISVAGSVNIKETVSAKFSSISGTLTVDVDKTLTLTGNTDSLNYSGSGTVNVYGTLNMNTTRWTIGSNNVINLYEGGTISGVGQSTNGALDWYRAGSINVYGTSTISANIRCRDNGNLSFNVVSGTCTFSGESYGSLPITKTGAGTLKIAYTGSSAYNLPSLGAGTIEFASGTWNLGSLRDLSGYTFTDGGNAVVKVAQTEAEYGKGLLEITSIDTSIEHVTVVKVDSTETTLNVSAGAASMGDGTAVVGGKACTYDWEFNGNLSSIGYNTTALSYDTDMSDANSFDGTGKLYIRTHPYYNGTWTWAGNWTVAIKCTVPTTTKGMVITFGNQGTACVGLATSENDGKVILFKAGANGAAETISEMAVSGRSTAQHLYIFSKTSDGKIKVYCDDTLIDDKSVSGLGSLPGTLQVGSLHGGVSYINLNRPASDDPATIDFVQVYNYGITDAQRSALISNYAWVNPNQYTRTVSGDESLSSSDAWTKPSDSSTVALPVTDADAIVTTSSSSAALAVNADFEADTLTINSGADGAALRIKAGTGTLSAAKVVVNVPVTIEYGAVDFSGSVVTFGEGGSLTYDFSGVAINSRTTRLVAKLTGLVEAPADLSDASTWPVQVITHSDASSLAACYESTFSYDTDASAYYYVCGPDHDWGSDVYYTGGYWSSDSGNTISVTNAAGVTTKVFAGDTVVIPAYYPNATTWSDNTLPANVTKIRVAKSKIKVCSGANSGDIFTGVTWTVDNGCVLWFGVDSKTTSLGAMTINGPGTVECGNITINGTMSGNAPIKILDNVTTRLTSTGSIATDHTISGGSSATITVAKTTPISERMAFGTWTGTVVLPENFNASNNGVDLHYYGKEGSTIEINGFTGWLKTGETYSGAGTHGRQPRPHLKLNGNFSINGLSAAYYDIIGGISGSGNFSLSSNNKPSGESFWITKVSGYTGSIINNTTGSAETTIVIKELVADTFVGGTKILSRGGAGPLSVNKVTVDETEQSLSDLCYESDGVYVAAAEYNSVKYYSVAAAITEAGDENLADITLLNGCTTVPDGYYLSGEAGSEKLTLCAARSGEEGSYVYYADAMAIFLALMEQKDLVLTVLDGNGATYESDLKPYIPALTYNETDQTLYLVVAKIGETGYRSFAAAIDAATSGQTIQLISSSGEAITLDKTIILSGASFFSGTFTGTGKVTLDALMQQTIVAAGWSGTVVLPEVSGVSGVLNLAYYGVSGSTVELTSMSGYFQHTGSTYNFDIAPNIKVSGSCTVLSEATSGLYYSFQTISGTGTLTLNNNANSISVAKVSDFSGSIVNNSAAALTIARLELSAAPTAGQCVLTTGGTGTVNISSVYVGETQQDVILEKKTDGIYVAAKKSVDSVVIAGDDEQTSVTVLDTGSNTEIDATGVSGKVAIPGTVAQITGVAAENLLLKVTYTPDGGDSTTGYYAGILTLDASGNVSLDGSATVDGVKVQPTIGESVTVAVGEEEVPATALSDSGAPSFAIKTIPGLWYAVKESTDASTFTADADTLVQATSDGTLLSADAPSSGVKYYKIAVGASKAALQ